MNLRDLALEALDYIEADGDADLDTASTRQIARIIADLNASVEEMRGAAPHLFRQEFEVTMTGGTGKVALPGALNIEASGLTLGDDTPLHLSGSRKEARDLAKLGIAAAWITADLATSTRLLYLNITPAPTADTSISGLGRYSGSKITTGSLAPAAPDYVVVPGGQHEAIFRAIFLYRWAASPWFRNREATQELARQYQNALALLAAPSDDVQTVTFTSGY